MKISHNSSSNGHTEKKKKKTLSKVSDNKIQAEWRNTIEMSLYNNIASSALKKIANFIGSDHYVNFYPFLVAHTMSMSTASYGVSWAITSVIETMRDVCNEAANIILTESSDRANIPKTPVAITLLCETLDMPEVTLDQIDSNDELVDRTPLQVRHILTNDRNRGWLEQYKNAGAEKIIVFTVRLGPGTTRATPTTGRYIVSILLPLTAPTYRLAPKHESHSHTHEDLEVKFRNQLIELTAHKRMAESVSKGKHTPYDEALILARQLQHKELERLRHLSSDQSTQLAVFARQASEFTNMMESPAFKNTQALENALVVLNKKLKEGMRRNAVLLDIIDAQQKGDFPVNLSEKKFRETIASIVENPARLTHYKKRKLNDNGTHTKSPVISSSDNSEDDDEEEEDEDDGYDDDPSDYESDDEEDESS